MDQITRNNLEALVTKVTAHLMKMVDKAIDEADGVALLPERELGAIRDRALHETVVATRVRLHAEAWVDDTTAYALKLVEEAVSRKMQKAVGNVRRGSPVF